MNGGASGQNKTGFQQKPIDTFQSNIQKEPKLDTLFMTTRFIRTRLYSNHDELACAQIVHDAVPITTQPIRNLSIRLTAKK